MEKTLVLIKPDAVRAKHIGDIIKIYEEKGLEILAMKMLKMNEKLASKHYEEHIGRDYYDDLMSFMTSGPIVAMVLQGEGAITGEHVQNNLSVREMLGQRGIKPEELPPFEDIKKLERRVKSQEKKLAVQVGKLPESTADKQP